MDICLKEDVVDGNDWLAVRPQPFLGNDVNEKSPTMTTDWIILFNFDSNWSLTIDSK